MVKYYYFALIAVIVMFGLYMITDNILTRMAEMQQVSRQVIER